MITVRYENQEWMFGCLTKNRMNFALDRRSVVLLRKKINACPKCNKGHLHGEKRTFQKMNAGLEFSPGGKLPPLQAFEIVVS